MLYRLNKLSSVDKNLINALQDLLQSTSQNLILFLGVAYMLVMLGLVLSQPGEFQIKFAPLTGVGLLTFGLALWALPHRLLVSQISLLVGLLAIITLAIFIFRREGITFYYILIPLVSAVIFGWPGALLAEILVGGIVIGFIQNPSINHLTASDGWMVILLGFVNGALGWAATAALVTVTQWSFFHYEQARTNLEESRNQRIELKQIQEDLVRANRELLRLSDRLKLMNQVAEEARRVKQEFVANVSHELRTPLNMIIGFCEMISQHPQVYGRKLPQILLSDIAAIQRNSQHLADLVNDVLDLSQYEAGRMALSKEWHSLQDIVDSSIEAVKALYISKNLTLETELPPEPLMVYCDITRIREVVLNLLSNAGRFTERGGVIVKAWLTETEAVISITDSGPGIAPQDQKRIFEPFQQLETSINRRFGGSGLGLSISQRFVEMHGGRIWLESQLGAGATFFFSLPMETPLPEEVGLGAFRRWINPYFQYEARTRPFKAPLPKLTPRFVILEQEGMLHKLFDHYLDEAEVIAVDTPAEACNQLNQSPSQALIVNAPVPKDISTFPANLNIPYSTPIVTCWLPGERQVARNLGVVKYLTKPISPQVLLSTLDSLGKEIRDILLVDDEPEVLQLFTRMLSSASTRYKVYRAMNGNQALELLTERHPDVMLLDLVLPDLDGFQVLQQKSQLPGLNDIPVIAISSLDPTGEPNIIDSFTVSLRGGFSAKNLLTCIQAIVEILTPMPRQSDPGTPAGSAA